MLEVSTSGYYSWRKRAPSQRDVENEKLLEDIEEVHDNSFGTYGRPRVTVELNESYDWEVGERRVGRLMRENGIQGHQPKAETWTTESDHDRPCAPNLVQQDFTAEGPNEVWLADITYVPTEQGWMYLAAVLDIYSRKIVGWSMDDSMTAQLTSDALTMAVFRQKPADGLTHHSDRGVQYASEDYQNLLDEFDIECSMSRKGNCLDNAPMESFFGTLKTESLRRASFDTEEQAKNRIFTYIERFYNRKRRHSALDYMSPAEYEKNDESLAA
jgi:transposase InsO family protein